MATWIPAAISAGASMFGHLLNRGGGPKPQNVDIGFIDEEISGVRKRQDELFNRSMRANNAQSGFAGNMQGRMAAGMGNPAAMNAVESMGTQNTESMMSAFLSNDVNVQSLINNLQGMKAGVLTSNANRQAELEYYNDMARRNDINSVVTGVAGAGHQYMNDRRDNKRFNELTGIMKNSMNMLDTHYSQLNPLNSVFSQDWDQMNRFQNLRNAPIR